MSESFDPTRPPPDADAASRPKIPDSVSIAVELWAVVVLGQIVALFAQSGTYVDTVRDQLRRNPQEGVSAEQFDAMTSSGFIIGILVVMALVLTALTAVVVWLTRKGYAWARIVLSAMGVYIVVSMLFALFGGGDLSPSWAMVPLVISGVAALGSTVMLLRRDADQYCRDMARARKKPTLPPPPPGGQYGQSPYGQNPYRQSPYGQSPYGQNPYGPNPYAQNPPYGQSPHSQDPHGQDPHGQNLYGQYPQAPAEPEGQRSPNHEDSPYRDSGRADQSESTGPHSEGRENQ